MLSRAYNEAVLAVLEKDFKEYLSQFDVKEEIPEVLEEAEMRTYFWRGIRLVILSWSAELEDGTPGWGLGGDEALLRWFKENGKPRRFILFSETFDVYESTDNVSDEETADALRTCFKRCKTVRFSNEAQGLGTVADHLSMLEKFDREADM